MMKENGSCTLSTPRCYVNALIDYMAALKMPGYPKGGPVEEFFLSPNGGLLVLLVRTMALSQSSVAEHASLPKRRGHNRLWCPDKKGGSLIGAVKRARGGRAAR